MAACSLSPAAGVSAAVLAGVAGPGQTVLEADGQAAYRLDAATEAQIEELRQKLTVLNGTLQLAMKQLTE